jgi:hypothetical protein
MHGTKQQIGELLMRIQPDEKPKYLRVIGDTERELLIQRRRVLRRGASIDIRRMKAKAPRELFTFCVR